MHIYNLYKINKKLYYNEYSKQNVHEIVRKKMLYCIKQWDETFGSDPTLRYRSKTKYLFNILLVNNIKFFFFFF